MLKKDAIKNNKTNGKASQPKEYFYAIGRRKASSARVKLFKDGSGKIIVNGKDYKKYFSYYTWQESLEKPFEVIGMKNKFNVEVKVVGGGIKGQSDACLLGISRALIKVNEDYRKLLRAEGFITRDSRAKERKKPGLKKARRAPQWSKR